MFTSRTRVGFAACATLAALGLAAAPAVHAQSLSLKSGDAVTVSGAGTVGTIASTKTSYDDSDSTVFGYNGYAVQTTGTAVFALATGGTLAGTHSSFSGSGLLAKGSGAITITGGTLTGGYAGIGLSAGGSSPVTISGGTFTAGTYGVGLSASGSASVAITGGTFTVGDSSNALMSQGNSTVTITGGTFVSGGNGEGLYASGKGSITLFSLGDTPFFIDGVAMNNTNLGSYTSGNDTISGTLLNGDTLNTTFYNTGTFTLNTAPAAAPEPSQFAAFSIGLLGLGALAMKARRRQDAL